LGSWQAAREPQAGIATSDRRAREVAAEAFDGDFLGLTIGLGTRVNGRETRTKARERGVKRRARVLRRSLVAADLVGLAVAFLVVQAFVSAFQERDLLISLLLLPGLAGWVLLAHTYGLYEHEEIGVARSTADDLPSVVMLSTLATWLGILVINAADLAHPRLHTTASFWLGSIVAIASARAVARAVVQRHGVREPTVIVGTGRVGRRIAQKVGMRPEYGLELVGFVDDDPLELPADAPPFLGDTSRLEQIVRAYRIERVIVAFSKLSGDEQVDLLRRCADLGVRVDIVPRMYEVIGSRTHFHDIAGIPLVSVQPPALSRSARMLKRGLDIAVAGIAVLLLSPFMLFAALRIKAGSEGPVLFRQERMGAGGRRFHILKFRSMYCDADERKAEVGHLNMHSEEGPRMFKVSEDPRITPFGRFLRKWSLDELPQLLNVLRGEMSLVGPRPLILDEDENIVGHHRRRLNITPGVTGLWQVLGRSDIPFSEMVTLDYLYVTNWSLWGDIKLLARTVPVVLSRRGAY
jgi:exopolysaccharide biosynthesis polyprenyl glycosylphosphotransferase